MEVREGVSLFLTPLHRKKERGVKEKSLLGDIGKSESEKEINFPLFCGEKNVSIRKYMH